MDNSDVSVSTITWARSAEEESLLRRALTALARLEIPVFVSDGGSGNDFLDFLRSFPHFTVVQPKAKGVFAQAKSAVIAAGEHGSDFILYTEPDKLSFFEHHLTGFLSTAALQEQTGVVLASRSGPAFATFPAFQQMTETTINKCCNEISGKAVDYTYGPFLFNRRLIPYLEAVQEDVGWGWRPYIFGIAKRLNYNFESFEGYFACPVEQRQDTPAERLYRMRQLTQNIEGVVLSATIKV